MFFEIKKSQPIFVLLFAEFGRKSGLGFRWAGNVGFDVNVGFPSLTAGGGSGGGVVSVGDIQGADRTGVHREGLVRGGLVVWVRGLGRDIAFAWVLTSESGSLIPASAASGGSGGGLGSVCKWGWVDHTP